MQSIFEVLHTNIQTRQVSRTTTQQVSSRQSVTTQKDSYRKQAYSGRQGLHLLRMSEVGIWYLPQWQTECSHTRFYSLRQEQTMYTRDLCNGWEPQSDQTMRQDLCKKQVSRTVRNSRISQISNSTLSYQHKCRKSHLDSTRNSPQYRTRKQLHKPALDRS